MPTDLEPRIVDQRGEPFDDFDEAIRGIAAALRNRTTVAFEYHHYSAFKMVLTWHIAGAYALTVGYTNKPATTVIWWAGGDRPESRARSLGLNRGHDTDTIAALLSALGAALTGQALGDMRQADG
jgi:hypothetical protein